MTNLPLPGPGRITCALLALVPAALGYPWSSARERWVLAVAVAVLIVLLGWWKGLHLTTILRRRVALVRRRDDDHTGRRSDVRATVLLRLVASPAEPGLLPLPLLAGYLNRYGLRADTARITCRETHSASGKPAHDTWVGLTFSAVDNLAALRARSAQIPLQETAEVAVRRLADHLREIGWETAPASAADIPELFDAAARETWHGLTDDAAGCVAAYQIGVSPDTLSAALAEIADCGAVQTWTVVELAGAAHHRTIAAGCALRTADAGGPPLNELIPQHGNHRAALRALHPLSGQRLPGHTEVSADTVAALRWPGTPVSTARHAAVS